MVGFTEERGEGGGGGGVAMRLSRLWVWCAIGAPGAAPGAATGPALTSLESHPNRWLMSGDDTRPILSS